MYGSNTKSIQNSIGSSMRMNPGEEMSVITVNEKSTFLSLRAFV
jgi:hypothetical protein